MDNFDFNLKLNNLVEKAIDSGRTKQEVEELLYNFFLTVHLEEDEFFYKAQYKSQ